MSESDTDSGNQPPRDDIVVVTTTITSDSDADAGDAANDESTPDSSDAEEQPPNHWSVVFPGLVSYLSSGTFHFLENCSPFVSC